ncbi:hypothetical protein TNCV_1676671 [Trichonephila clavipes]|nr:hypothetical protein TNCV_1676671 [Trichonephila clavipes]
MKKTWIDLRMLRRRSSSVVKVTDSWLACHEFEPSTTDDPPCRGAMSVKSVASSNFLPLVWYDVVVREEWSASSDVVLVS